MRAQRRGVSPADGPCESTVERWVPVPQPRWLAAATIGAIAVAGAMVRISALVRTGGPLAYYVDYDEGVYSSGASVLARGHQPYHDFVFVHPPGILYILAPFGVLSPYRALAAGRFLSVLFGTVSIVIIGAIAYRAWGLIAGAVGALVYASFAEVAAAEHGVFLEPALNVFSLAALACWLHGRRDDDEGDDTVPAANRRWNRWAVAAGALAAMACTIKLWAILLVVAMLFAPPRVRRAWHLRSFAVGLVPVGVLLWLPVLIGGPADVLNPVVRFQLSRPADGASELGDRLKFVFANPDDLLNSRHLVATVMAVLGCSVALTVRRHDRLARVAVLWWPLLVVTFLSAATYWDQYNAALAPSMALLAACLASVVAPLLRGGSVVRVGGGLVAAVLLLVPAWSLRSVWTESSVRATDLAAVRDELNRTVPEGECVVSFEPAWLLAANRLPQLEGNRFVAVDPYAAMLTRIQDRSVAAATTADAFATQPIDDGVLDSFTACRYALLGWRGHWQLSPEQQAWFAARYHQVAPGPVDVWKRN
jgi:hypothetical protein